MQEAKRDSLAKLTRTTLPVLALVAFWLPVLRPLIQPGMMTRSSDGVLHFLRAFQLDTLVRQGIFWPRWSPGMVFGYGYPLFSFYPALSLYPSLILHRLGLSLLQSWNLSLALSVLASGLSMYLWAALVIGRRGAFVAAIAYMLAPYQLYDVYWRGNITESLTLPLLPLVMWAALRVAQERRWHYALVGALAYAAVLLMHAPASLMLSLVLLTYLLALLWRAQERHEIVFQFAGLLILGVGLAAFFLIPAYGERSQVQLVRAVSAGWADFRAHFLSLGELLGLTQPGDLVLVDPAPPRSLGWAAAGLAAVSALATWWGRARVGSTHGQHVVWAGLILIGAVGMTSSISEPIWLHMPLLSGILPFIQYPSRFLGMGSLVAALLAGAGVAAMEIYVKSEARRWVVMGACAAILAVGAWPWAQARLRPMRENPDQAFYTAVERNTGFIGTTTFGEYLPSAVQELPTDSPLVGPMLAGQSVVRWDVPGARILKVSDTGLSAELVLEADVPIRVMYRAFYFPGWQAQLDAQPVAVSVVPPLGLMALDVPAGHHTLTMRFASTPLRSASTIVSLLAIVAIGAIWILDRRSMPLKGRPKSGFDADISPPLDNSAAGTRGLLGRLLSARSTFDTPHAVTWLGLAVLGVVLLVLQVGVMDRVAVPLRWWRVEGGQTRLAFAAPAMLHQVDVRLGDGITLVGFDTPDRASPGQVATVKLVWRARGQVNQEYKVFVHLLGADGRLVAQSDAVPAGWTRPTFGWQVGEFVTDVHTLELPPDLTPGVYRLVVGMYDIAGQRLPVAGGGDVVDLGPVQVNLKG
jgi:hypothetical protein